MTEDQLLVVWRVLTRLEDLERFRCLADLALDQTARPLTEHQQSIEYCGTLLTEFLRLFDNCISDMESDIKSLGKQVQ